LEHTALQISTHYLIISAIPQPGKALATNWTTVLRFPRSIFLFETTMDSKDTFLCNFFDITHVADVLIIIAWIGHFSHISSTGERCFSVLLFIFFLGHN
jgi:hypothetical protein